MHSSKKNLKKGELSRIVILKQKDILKSGDLSKLSLYKSIYRSEIFYILSKNGKIYVLQNDKLISGEMEFRKYNFKGILNTVTGSIPLTNIDFKIYKTDDVWIRDNGTKRLVKLCCKTI